MIEIIEPQTNIVPFGKYKGQPVEVLQQDIQYLEWIRPISATAN